MRFSDLLVESVMQVNGVLVFKNPSKANLERIFTDCRKLVQDMPIYNKKIFTECARAFILDDGSSYAWMGLAITHFQMYSELGIEYNGNYLNTIGLMLTPSKVYIAVSNSSDFADIWESYSPEYIYDTIQNHPMIKNLYGKIPYPIQISPEM